MWIPTVTVLNRHARLGVSSQLGECGGKAVRIHDGVDTEATVRGTIWLTEERCGGTFFRVRRGTVSVRDFTRRKTKRLRKGQRYLAPARR